MTEPRDGASVLVFPFAGIRRDAAGRTPGWATAHGSMTWSPMWKALRRAAFGTVMETTELRDRDDGAFVQVDNRPRRA